MGAPINDEGKRIYGAPRQNKRGGIWVLPPWVSGLFVLGLDHFGGETHVLLSPANWLVIVRLSSCMYQYFRGSGNMMSLLRWVSLWANEPPRRIPPKRRIEIQSNLPVLQLE